MYLFSLRSCCATYVGLRVFSSTCSAGPSSNASNWKCASDSFRKHHNCLTFLLPVGKELTGTCTIQKHVRALLASPLRLKESCGSCAPNCGKVQFQTGRLPNYGSLNNARKNCLKLETFTDLENAHCMKSVNFDDFDSIIYYKVHDVPKCLSLYSSSPPNHNPSAVHQMNNYSKAGGKQPVDDPKLKIRVLTEKLSREFPFIFDRRKDWHDFSIYTENIELNITFHKPLKQDGRISKKSDAKSSKKFQGIFAYKCAATLARRWFMHYLDRPTFDLLTIHCDENRRVIEARWRVFGWTPAQLISTFLFRWPSEQPRCYDFMSHLHVNKDGKVWLHEIEKTRRLSDAQPVAQAWKRRALAAVSALVGKPIATGYRHDSRRPQVRRAVASARTPPRCSDGSTSSLMDVTT